MQKISKMCHRFRTCCTLPTLPIFRWGRLSRAARHSSLTHLCTQQCDYSALTDDSESRVSDRVCLALLIVTVQVQLQQTENAQSIEQAAMWETRWREVQAEMASTSAGIGASLLDANFRCTLSLITLTVLTLLCPSLRCIDAHARDFD